jgi:hypothetical protein
MELLERSLFEVSKVTVEVDMRVPARLKASRSSQVQLQLALETDRPHDLI